ncbi:MAG: hypothetical protein WBA44_02185 [Mesorhizobium sp.]
MAATPAEPVRIGRFAITVDALVVASFILTALAGLAVWQWRENTSLDTWVDRHVRNREAVDLPARAAQLAAEARGKSDDELTQIANGLVGETTPHSMTLLTMYLIRDHREPEARRLGVIASELGGTHWNWPNLLFRAGREYGLGRFVERDFAKATRYLSHPTLANTVSAQFALGSALTNADNPNRDVERGKALLRKAAQSGYDPAIKLLATMPD